MSGWGGVISVGAAIVAAIPAAASTQHCLRVRAPLAAESFAASRDFEAASCPEHVSRDAFRYDARTGAARVVRDLAPGEIVTAFSGFDAGAIAPGDRLTLVTVEGPVRIEREVTAMQAAGPGRRLFVKGADGAVISVRYEQVAP